MKVFITGVSSGIGQALARLMLKEGHMVWGVARRQTGLDKLIFTQADVSQEGDVNKVMAVMKEKNFIPDVAVLNAGVYEVDMEQVYNHEVASRVYDINLYGAMIWVEKFLPDFLARKNAQFIAISSIAAYRPDEWSSSYSASKAALSMSFRSFRLRYHDSGVKFKTIHFGPVDTLVIPRFADSKKGGWVVSASAAARYISQVIKSHKQNFYYPLNSWLIRLTAFIPDRIFHVLTKGFRR